MKNLLEGTLDTPGYVLNESVINCFRLSGSMVLLLMKYHGIIYNRDFQAVRTVKF